MKYVIGKTNMPGSASIAAAKINMDGCGEVYFLSDVPMHKVRTFLNHLIAQVKDGTRLVIVTGVDREKLTEVAGIGEDSEIYQWSGK